MSDAAKILEALIDLVHHSESDSARIAAAKILLERMAPEEDDEARRREAEERDAAIAEARCLLAESAAAKSTEFYQPTALDQIGAPEPADTASGAA
ncbi:MAG: hypothetical protein SFW62_03525 [Alphaproteobacteria bacterium]|nr:hypothetical protein [Alphaproteobacteria bacterium]